MFPEAGVRMKPRTGNLLAWCNLELDGSVNAASLHCGEPVERGVKYIATKWFRERQFSADRLNVHVQAHETSQSVACES
jgi:prolyl 4-hydroxylase